MLEHKMVSNAIEKAQRRVEENNYGIRKRLVEYDDVMNNQRNVIYTRRQHALDGERLANDIANVIEDTVNDVIGRFESDYALLTTEVYRVFSIELPYTQEEYVNLDTDERVERLQKAVFEAQERRNAKIVEVAMPVINNLMANSDYRGKIIVPISDGKRVYHLRIDLDQAVATNGQNIIKEWQKAISLVCIDEYWMEHLREVDQLRQSVQNASYEQKDPLVIYKIEAFHLFQDMLSRLNSKTLSSLMRAFIPEPERKEEGAPQPQVQHAAPEMPRRYNYQTSKATLPGEESAQQQAQRRAAAAPQGQQQRVMPITVGPRVGRNDPCPCGSGKKYKNCHGRNA